MEKINSHIQMPKGVLKKFVNKDQQLFYYDISLSKVTKGHPRSLNAKENWFDKAMEDFLNKNIEGPFKKVLDYIENHIDDNPFVISNNATRDIENYFYALQARNPKMCMDAIENTQLAKDFLSEQTQHILMVLSAFEWLKSEKIFERYSVTYLKNDTDTPFILPIMGMYAMLGGYFIMPVTEKIAIVLIENHLLAKLKDSEGRIALLKVVSETDVNFYNKCAMEYQKALGYGYVVSSNRQLLERLKREMGI